MLLRLASRPGRYEPFSIASVSEGKISPKLGRPKSVRLRRRVRGLIETGESSGRGDSTTARGIYPLVLLADRIEGDVVALVLRELLGEVDLRQEESKGRPAVSSLRNTKDDATNRNLEDVRWRVVGVSVFGRRRLCRGTQTRTDTKALLHLGQQRLEPAKRSGVPLSSRTKEKKTRQSSQGAGATWRERLTQIQMNSTFLRDPKFPRLCRYLQASLFSVYVE